MLNRLIVFVFFCMTFIQCNTKNTESKSVDNTEKNGTSQGRQLYNKNCASCHTSTKGTYEPTLTTMSNWEQEELNKRIAAIKKDSVHYSYFENLTSTDINAIQYYIKHEFLAPTNPIP